MSKIVKAKPHVLFPQSSCQSFVGTYKQLANTNLISMIF